MNRRTFTFASLASFATVAQAAEPDANRSKIALEGRWTGAIHAGVLTLTLAVHNAGTEPIQALVAVGTRPAPVVCASLVVGHDEVALAAAPREMDVRELMSRMGPMPSYAMVAPDSDVVIGTFAFTLPTGSGAEVIRVTATVETASGAVVLAHQFDPADVPRG